MATTLDFLVPPTYNKYTMGVMDNSTYDVVPTAPKLTITAPGFDPVDVVFVPDVMNIIDSLDLELTAIGEDLLPLPDGVYTILYTTDAVPTYSLEKNIMRVDKLQEKFDEAFMQLDIMECDKAIKMQAKVDLNTIYFFIQGAIAAANNCAILEANKLYLQATKLLNSFTRNNCGCSGNNYVINF